MSVSAISTTAVQSSEPQISSRRLQEDKAGRQLLQALNSGDLSAAQQAYDTLASYGPTSSGPFRSSALNQQFQTLGQDIQSGNLSAAQQAAQSLGKNLLQQDLSQARKAYEGSGWPGAENSVANLAGDFWAVTGKRLNLPSQAPSPTENSEGSNSISENA